MGSSGILLVGLALGLKHALEPDHLGAVSTTFASRSRIERSVGIGLLWGLGHAAAILLLGGGVLLLDLSLSPVRMAAGELAIGLVVAAMGLDLLLRLRRERGHIHVHEHDGLRHAHLHGHRDDPGHQHRHLEGRALLLGLAHGLAGSGVLALLAAAASRSPGEGVAFLACFGLGAMLAMGLVAGGIHLGLRAAERAGVRLLFGLRAASGALALGSGTLVVTVAARQVAAAW